MKAIRRFTVRPVLPEALHPLSELARNLRWSWHAETRDLFQSVDPERWASSGGDPVRLLGSVSTRRLAELTEDRRFLRRLTAAADDLRDYVTGDRWYQEQGRGRRKGRHGHRRPNSRPPSPTSRPSSASRPRCRSTPAASASSPATI